jgi:hypothetical protein
MLACPVRVIEFGIAGKWKAVSTGAEVLTVTVSTMREGLGQVVRFVIVFEQLLNVVTLPVESSQEQDNVVVADRLVMSGASCVAASEMFGASEAVVWFCAAYEAPARAALLTSILA